MRTLRKVCRNHLTLEHTAPPTGSPQTSPIPEPLASASGAPGMIVRYRDPLTKPCCNWELGDGNEEKDRELAFV